MRVLVVEDETKLATLLARALGEEGYIVDVAANGEDALWAGTEQAYDVVLLDLGLDDVDGLDVCRALRERSVWCPIIAVTARDDVPSRVAGLDAGADDYVTKPFAVDELLARMRAVVRRGAAPRPAVLAYAGLTLDPSTRAVHRGDARIDLTAKEYELLVYFMHNAGRVVSRTELVEHVWDTAFAGDLRVVDVYVRYLRRKLDEPFGTDTIETARGAGYRFRDRQ